MVEVVKETCDRWIADKIANVYHNRNNGANNYTLYIRYNEVRNLKLSDLRDLRDLLDTVLDDEVEEE